METETVISPKSFCFTSTSRACPIPEPGEQCMVLFVAELHKNVSSTNSEDSKWPQKFILLLSRAVTLILSSQPVVTSLRSKGRSLLIFWLRQGAQGVTLSVQLRSLNLHISLSVSGLYQGLSGGSLRFLRSFSDPRSLSALLAYFVGQTEPKMLRLVKIGLVSFVK